MDKKIYQWETNSNAAPFVSDTDSGFIEAEDSKTALEKIVKDYKHPCGLYAAVIKEVSVENRVVARYLSSRAATLQDAPSGLREWREDELYINNKRMEDKEERYENKE